MNIIVANCKKNNGIGKNNKIPWFLKNDLKNFQQITSKTFKPYTKNMVVMGRKTWDSIPDKHKPLKNRLNVVLTHNKDVRLKHKIESYKDTIVKYDFNEILEVAKLNMDFNISNIFIIGGESLYKMALESENISKIYVTEVYDDYECDTFFPQIDKEKYKLSYISNFYSENNIYYRYLEYVNKNNDSIEPWINKEEQQYLDTLHNIITNGIETEDRTGVGTYSLFGEKFTYNLEDTFPALTTKKIFLRGVFEELMLYLSGKTDNAILNDKKINIWDGNTSREFLDIRGLNHYPEGDMGETYGFNFRHYGGFYSTCKDDYKGTGFDQLEYILYLIKNDPNSRRIIINLWNPATMNKAALPACLCFYQFYVDTRNKKLNLQIYIRSSDYFLANNWNTLTGAFLVNMICNLKDINLSPGKLTVITGDTHIYKNHVDQVNENLLRTPRPFPKLVFNGGQKDSIYDYKYEDVRLIDYCPYKNIKAPMAV
jgi:dihydrofolate reductase / thymidylate synthase